MCLECSSGIEHLWWAPPILLYIRWSNKVLWLIGVQHLWPTRETKRHTLELLGHQRTSHHLLGRELLLLVTKRWLLHAISIIHWLLLELWVLLHLLSLLLDLRRVVWWRRWWGHQATLLFLIILAFATVFYVLILGDFLLFHIIFI